MMISAQNVNGLSDDEIIEILKQSIKGRSVNYSATSNRASCFSHHCTGYDDT